ncbi:MAG: hypothetical protein KAT11_04520, partial [Phycisphaerae bacterium]|nr:hypothetical protein [Phycisphaerae bacterium]
MTKGLHKWQLFGLVLCLAAWLGAGCNKPADYRREADQAAAKIIEQKQVEALGRSEAFSIERPAETLRRQILLASGL